MTSLLHETDTRGVTTLTLNRPERYNAFDDNLIEALIEALDKVDRDDGVRILLLRASGKHFCAGADLNWMQRTADYSDEENRADALQLANLLDRLNRLSKPVIGVVQGATYGGGIGLIACCDIAMAYDESVFCLSEVRLGLVPATIAPYVIAAIGARAARRYMLSAEQFDAQQACRLGLVHEVAPPTDTEQRLAAILDALLQGGPGAQATTKRLIARVTPLDDELIAATADIIAERRASAEGREGLSAFFDKRKPDWNES